MSIDHLTPSQLRQVCTLLSSRDDAVHSQGLELLETLAPAGPGAMRGVHLPDIGATHPDLSGRDLAGARFWRSGRGYRMPASLSGACLVGAAMFPGNISGIDLSGADLRYCRLHVRYSSSARIRWSHPRLAGADLRGAWLGPLDLKGVDLTGERWAGADLRGVNLSGADFRGGRFSGLDLSGANLSGADLSGANLRGTTLVGADLTDARLFRVNLKGADLTGAAMVFSDTIRWDARTRFPAGQAPKPGQRPSRHHPRYRYRGA